MRTRSKHVARTMSSVATARKNKDVYIHSWPQPVPKDVEFRCVDVYYETIQLQIPPTCVFKTTARS